MFMKHLRVITEQGTNALASRKILLPINYLMSTGRTHRPSAPEALWGLEVPGGLGEWGEKRGFLFPLLCKQSNWLGPNAVAFEAHLTEGT